MIGSNGLKGVGAREDKTRKEKGYEGMWEEIILDFGEAEESKKSET